MFFLDDHFTRKLKPESMQSIGCNPSIENCSAGSHRHMEPVSQVLNKSPSVSLINTIKNSSISLKDQNYSLPTLTSSDKHSKVPAFGIPV
ncbi:hypothetical protein DPMN_131081 [Dreissena polymorpha]|uniref:Uncharacterized protein n=1 Tax=Dreissena polymorpha TaxID=45954 RepID=A0A9D4H7V6_DREPO|nr:hypothetical protein DPMN_131081 [Dreissena polymorpha]